MKHKKLIKAVCGVSAALLAASVSAYANQPYVNIAQPEVRQTQQPAEQAVEQAAEAPTEAPTEPPAVESGIFVEIEVTPDPMQELIQKQNEANRQQEENKNLLSEIKELVSGLFNKQKNSGTADGSNASGSAESAKTSASDAVSAADMEKLFSSFMQMGDGSGTNFTWVTPAPTEEPTPTPVPKKTSTDGNGYIIEDSQQLTDGKEFLTMASKDGTEFYMIIDRAKDNEVYMLNKFDSTDLAAFIENPSPSPSASPTEKPTATPKPTEEPTEGAVKSNEKTGVSGGTIVIMLLIAVGAVAVIYFFRNKNGGDSEEAADDEDEEEYSEDEDDKYELPEEEEDEDEEQEENEDNENSDEESEETE